MNLPKTWFIDFDGTLVHHKSHHSDEDFILEGTKDFFKENVKEEDVVVITTAREHFHKERIEKFLEKNEIKYNLVLCGLNSGARILINDKKPDGTITAYAYNLERDKGIKI
jgi:hydroxymethylpyrimidine pyrophosphatase-like HAD family hydrolase